MIVKHIYSFNCTTASEEKIYEMATLVSSHVTLGDTLSVIGPTTDVETWTDCIALDSSCTFELMQAKIANKIIEFLFNVGYGRKARYSFAFVIMGDGDATNDELLQPAIQEYVPEDQIHRESTSINYVTPLTMENIHDMLCNHAEYFNDFEAIDRYVQKTQEDAPFAMLDSHWASKKDNKRARRYKNRAEITAVMKTLQERFLNLYGMICAMSENLLQSKEDAKKETDQEKLIKSMRSDLIQAKRDITRLKNEQSKLRAFLSAKNEEEKPAAKKKAKRTFRVNDTQEEPKEEISTEKISVSPKA